ncbi:MAG: hypothetical protein ACREHG_01640 [Candidatus Saccharimonadales bacterium]
MEAATLEAPVPVHTEIAAPVPQPSVAEILDQHLDHSQQKKIAVENLSSIRFLIAPDGRSAISAKPLPSDTHRELVEASLKTVLGERPDNAPYLPAGERITDKLGLSSGSHYVELIGAGTIKMLAEAGVKDFAAALQEKKEQGHAARVR